MFRYISFLTLILILSPGCSRKNSFHIEGTLEGHQGEYIKIKKLEINTPVPLDSMKVGGSGSFVFRIKATEPEFYEIGISNNDFITLLAGPGERITLRFPGKFLSEAYRVTGSPGTAKLVMLDSALAVTMGKIRLLRMSYDSIEGKPDSKEKRAGLNSEYLKALKDQRMFNIDFILKNLNSFASIKALYQTIDSNTYVLYEPRDLQYLKLVSDTLTFHYPSSKQAKALKANFEQEYNQSKMNMVRELMNSLPETRLDPSLKDMNGRRIMLSSLRGKYVLLSFWSATSRDCVAENLQMKELYSKYRNRGFEIYQVNLDTNENTWRKAVRFDELPWINVREDNPYNPKTALLYNARVLPANYLYDKEGNIIGSNLHGRLLRLKLSQLLGN